MSAVMAIESVVPAALARPPTFATRLLRKPLAWVAIGWLLLVIVLASFPDQISSFDPLDQDLLAIKQLPSAEHYLGTDAIGRDVLSRLLHGAMPTLVGVLQAVLVVALLGVTLGMSAGYLGGRFDQAMSQVVSLVQAMPTIVILLAVLTVFDRSMIAAMVMLGILGSAGITRVIRSVTLAVRGELYIEAARICGLSDAAIILRHVLPRIIGPMIVQLSLFSAIAVLVQTGISFLGLGVQPPAPTWGSMIFDASVALNDFPWLLVPSGITVALTILSFGLLGDSLRDSAVEAWARPTRQRSRRQRTAPANAAATPPTVATDTLLSARNVTIVTGQAHSERTLVHGANLDLRAGETLGIVGESGSGKTLTILALMGLLPAGTHVQRGTVTIKGELIDLTDETRLAELRGRTLGMIFQEPMAALDPCFTIGHHLTEVIRRHHKSSARDAQTQAIELLRQVKIADPDDVARRYPHQVSGGMAQRVGIARALAPGPLILLADEPTTALDVTVQAEILELIRGLSQRRQMAVLFVTHDWGVVADICDRAMVLYQGRVLESATIDDIFARPQHPYTAALLKANPHSAPPGQPLPTIQDTLERMAREVAT